MLWAQGVNGVLSGRVTSADGSGIPNAAITVTNVSTNTAQRALTGPDGSFTVSGLPAGTYRVDVETVGFKRTSQQNVEITTTAGTPLTIRLEAGSPSETVELVGRTPSVQSSNGEKSVALASRTLKELPVIDRNHQELAGLQSGVTPPTPALDMVRDPSRNRFFSVNGQDPTANLYMMDGVYNQEPFRNTAIRVQPVENLQQMNVETAALPAERGFAAGGIVTDLTKAGTNGLHGSLFEFHSGSWLRTRNFMNFAGNPDPRFVYNQFGGTLSGPIFPDRTFFSGSYEGTYQNGGNTQIITVPTAAALTGNFSGIPGLVLYNPTSGINGTNRTVFPANQIPLSARNATAARIATFFPAPNLEGLTNNFISNVPFRNNGDKADGRIDHYFSDRTTMFLRYGYTNYRSYESSPLGDVIGAGTRGDLIAQNAIVGINHEFSPTLVTDMRFGYNRWDQRLYPWSDQTALGFAGSLPSINIAGFAPIGAPSYIPEHAVDNTFNWNWSLGWHTSMHNVKFGLDIRRLRSDGFLDAMFGSQFGANGSAFFGPGATLTNGGPALSQYGGFYNSFAAFLTGAPSQVGISNFLTTPTIRQTQYAGWVGDTLRVMDRVTLDLGVRYEIYSPLEARQAGGSQFWDPQRNVFSYAGIGNIVMNPQNYDLNNVAPRLGAAFRLTENTVIRGGYSFHFFERPYMLSGFMAPTYGFVSGVQGGYTTVPAFGATINPGTPPSTLVNGAAAGNQVVSFGLRDINTASVRSFHGEIQQGFRGGTMLSVGYVGARGHDLPYLQDVNAALPGTGIAGLPFGSLGRTANTFFFNNGLSSDYDSLQINLNKSFSKGLSLMASYTYSKALGYTGSNGLLLNPSNLASNWGPLDFDRQHSLSIAHVWELPFGRGGNSLLATIIGGWQVNGVFTWATGTPLTVTSDPLRCACPGTTLFANVSGDPYSNSGGLAYLNASAFSSPSAGQFGGLGRGALRDRENRNYNLSLFKNFRVRDHFNLQLRGEAFNVTNTPRYGTPVTNLSSPDFGRTVTATNDSFGRQINLGVRLQF